MAILRARWREYNETADAAHPLDPLSARELAAVTSTLRAHEDFAALSERTRFVTISLREPSEGRHPRLGRTGARRRAARPRR